MCSSPHSICKFLFKYMYILKMFQSTTFMWIWKQYFSECLEPSTCLHLNHYYRHSWKLKKKVKNTPLSGLSSVFTSYLERVLIPRAQVSPRDLALAPLQPHFILALVHCALAPRASFLSPHHTEVKVHPRVCTPVVPMPGCSSLYGGSYVIVPSTPVWLMQGSLTTLSKLVLGTTTLCSSICFIFWNT